MNWGDAVRLPHRERWILGAQATSCKSRAALGLNFFLTISAESPKARYFGQKHDSDSQPTGNGHGCRLGPFRNLLDSSPDFDPFWLI